MRRLPRLLLLLTVAAACGGDRPKGNVVINSTDGAKQPDDLAITTRDGVILGVRHDTVRVRLSDSARAKVKQEVAKETSDTSGFGIGSFIARKVGDAVAKTMDMELSVPVSSIKSVTQEDSSVRFVMRDGSKGLGFGNNSKSKGTIGSFAPADVEKFVKFLQPKLTP
jgi:hypothetical protein